MTYYVADANGYLTDIASTGGWHDFVTWVELKKNRASMDFVQHGVSHEPQALAHELSMMKSANASADSVRLGVIRAAQQASELLIISDGVGGGSKKGALKKAMPSRDRSNESDVKQAKQTKVASKQAGSKGKTRYNYPQDKDKKTSSTPSQQPAKEDPVTVPSERKPKHVDPQSLANQMQMPLATLTHIAQRFKRKPKLKGRIGFVAFMQTNLKAFAKKHGIDGDYFGLLYDKLVDDSAVANK